MYNVFFSPQFLSSQRYRHLLQLAFALERVANLQSWSVMMKILSLVILYSFLLLFPIIRMVEIAFFTYLFYYYSLYLLGFIYLNVLSLVNSFQLLRAIVIPRCTVVYSFSLIITCTILRHCPGVHILARSVGDKDHKWFFSLNAFQLKTYWDWHDARALLVGLYCSMVEIWVKRQIYFWQLQKRSHLWESFKRIKSFRDCCDFFF